MKAIEFEADIQDGIVKIPEVYTIFRDAHARVVILVNEAENIDVSEPKGQLDFSKFKIEAFDTVDGMGFQQEARRY